MKKQAVIFWIVMFCLSITALAQTDIQKLYDDAVADFDAKRYEQAIEKLKRVNSIDPGIPEAHYYLATSYYELDNYKDAISPFREAIRLKPDFFEAHVFLGNSLDYLNDSAAAFEMLNNFTHSKSQDYIFAYCRMYLSHTLTKTKSK